MSQPNFPQQQGRPADTVIQRSEVKLSGMALISRTQVKLWKAMLVSVFFAGLVGALGFLAGFQKNQEGGVDFEVEYEESEAALPKLPDLIASGTLTKITGNYLEGTVKNQGSIFASYFRTEFDIIWNVTTVPLSTARPDYSGWGVPDVEDLGPGESFKVRSNTDFQSGTHAIRLCADDGREHRIQKINDVIESNEKNNCGPYVLITFPRLQRLPDLVPEKPVILSIATSTTESCTGYASCFKVVFQSSLTNQGSALARDRSFNSFELDYGTLSFVKADFNTTPTQNAIVSDLAPGEKVLVQGRLYLATAVTGYQYALRLCSDVFEQVQESNEVNNCSPAVAVTLQQLLPSPLPDLTVENFKAPDSFTQGKSVVMSGTVCNRGKVATPKGGSVAFMDDAKVACQKYFPILKPNMCTAEFTCTGIPMTTNPEYYAAMFIFNPGFEEVTTSNNSAEKWIEVAPVPQPINSNTPKFEP